LCSHDGSSDPLAGSPTRLSSPAIDQGLARIASSSTSGGKKAEGNRDQRGQPEPVLQEVRLTAHGPILNDVEQRLADAPLMSLRWPAIAETDRTFEAILGLNTAGSFEEFRETLSLYGTPSQNFVYADVDGHIGYALGGAIPRRAQGDGRLPVPGWTGPECAQQAMYLPAQLDPAPRGEPAAGRCPHTATAVSSPLYNAGINPHAAGVLSIGCGAGDAHGHSPPAPRLRE